MSSSSPTQNLGDEILDKLRSIYPKEEDGTEENGIVSTLASAIAKYNENTTDVTTQIEAIKSLISNVTQMKDALNNKTAEKELQITNLTEQLSATGSASTAKNDLLQTQLSELKAEKLLLTTNQTSLNDVISSIVTKNIADSESVKESLASVVSSLKAVSKLESAADTTSTPAAPVSSLQALGHRRLQSVVRCRLIGDHTERMFVRDAHNTALRRLRRALFTAQTR
jgi:DNA-binding FrmR family transcriptional regulator